MPGVPNNPAPLVRKLVSAVRPQHAKDEIRGEHKRRLCSSILRIAHHRVNIACLILVFSTGSLLMFNNYC
jgi:hypothetical protein